MKKNIDIFRTLKQNVIIRMSLWVSFITCFVKLAGYAEKVLLAYFWGTSPEADAYNGIFMFITSIYVFFRELIEPGFLNIFLKTKYDRGDREAWVVFFSLAGCLLPLAILISICLFLWPHIIAKIILPGFMGDRFVLATSLLRISCFSCIFMIASTLTNITLNAYKRFSIAALGDLFFKLSIVLVMFLGGEMMGISSALWGLFAGSVFRLIIHLFALRLNIHTLVGRMNSSYLNQIWKLTWPLLIGITFSQVSAFVDNIFASYWEDGSLSALSYAKKVIELPIVIFPCALSVVVFPYFSELHIKRKISQLFTLFRKILICLVIFFIPLGLIFFFFSEIIIQLIFQRGAFDTQSTLLTSRVLAIYGLGMPAFAIETVLVIFYFSLSDTRTPVFVGIICVILNILVTWIGVHYIGYIGIATALVISKSIKVVALLYLLKYKQPLTETIYHNE